MCSTQFIFFFLLSAPIRRMYIYKHFHKDEVGEKNFLLDTLMYAGVQMCKWMCHR